jgi:hypothetical protein
MDWEHNYYQNPANANRRPPRAFYLDVLQRGMESYWLDEVEDCISAYHVADDEAQVTSQGPDDFEDIQAVGGSSWFSNNSSRSYTDYDSEMDHVAQYHYLAEPKLEEEKRVQGDRSKRILPSRDLSDVSRTQVTWNVPGSDRVDEVASDVTSGHRPDVTSRHGAARSPLGEEKRVEGDGSRKVLPPRDLSDISRMKVVQDVPIHDYIDGLALRL